MSVFLQDPDVTLYHGDVLDVLRELPDESVDCAATSPPFYGLRDYGVEGQIGLESTPELWRDRLVEVFREVRRVLVPTGTLWVECGDSYSGGGGYAGDQAPSNAARIAAGVGVGGQKVGPHTLSAKKSVGRLANVKAKDLIGAPFLLAFGLRDDGWWWRSTSIWHKPNCLPESVTDRPVVQHSYVFQFSKKARYFHDAEAVREPHESTRWGGKYSGPNAHQWKYADGAGNGKINERSERDHYPEGGRSLRSVWTIPTQGFPEAHFATWPTKLAERILLMACPERVCPECRAPWVREVETERNAGHISDSGYNAASSALHGSREGNYGSGGSKKVTTLGWRQSCGCVAQILGPGTAPYPPRPISGIVLDPFVGSGTTCHVARKLGRRSVGIDLSLSYLELAARRLAQQSLFADEATASSGPDGTPHSPGIPPDHGTSDTESQDSPEHVIASSDAG